MLQATGYSLHPAYFRSRAPHALKGADGYRVMNEKLNELRLAAKPAACKTKTNSATPPWYPCPKLPLRA